jgi:hypothetical protein
VRDKPSKSLSRLSHSSNRESGVCSLVAPFECEDIGGVGRFDSGIYGFEKYASISNSSSESVYSILAEGILRVVAPEAFSALRMSRRRDKQTLNVSVVFWENVTPSRSRDR